MNNDFEEIVKVVMRTAIRKHPKAKLWARMNHEDNFYLVIYSTAEGAMMDEVLRCIDDPIVVKWFNAKCGNTKQLRDFVINVCREIYKELK